jgi:hypothetical protein
MIVAKVSARLGPQWVPTALRIAKIESGMRCDPGGNRGGVFQVSDPARFGVSPAAVRTCQGGVDAGVAHMESCLAKGAGNSRLMMVCHNAGTPYARRVESAYRFAMR